MLEPAPSVYEIIGRAMKNWRMRVKLSAGMVAASLEIDTGNFSKYESGQRHADAEFLVRWAHAIGVNPRYPLEKYDEFVRGGRKTIRKR